MSTPIFEVLKPGFLTTVQDRGRFYYQCMGASLSGALDSFSHRIGNFLVGNSEDAAGLEMTVAGPTMRILQDTWIAITGANISPKKDGLPLSMWTSVKVEEGNIISFGPLKEGCRGYLAVRGGISVPLVMGSCSTDLRLKEGGKEGRPLQTGDLLEIEPSESRYEFIEKALSPEWIPCYGSNPTLRVIMGPQARYFDKETGIKTFLESEYVVTPKANRIGYRLDGPAILHKEGLEASIPTEACCPGGIQVPEDGKPIILMVEQNGGGYIKIATIISSDFDLIAQLKPGDKIRFGKISVAKAHQILKKREKIIQRLKARLDSTN